MSALRKQSPTWVMVLTHGLPSEFCAFHKEGSTSVSWDILLNQLTAYIRSAPDTRLELAIFVSCYGGYPAKQLEKSGVDVIAWPGKPLSVLSFEFAKDVLAEFVRGDAHLDGGLSDRLEAAFRAALEDFNEEGELFLEAKLKQRQREKADRLAGEVASAPLSFQENNAERKSNGKTYR
eukprot:2711602-Amphidinium_carterae.1